MLKKEDFIVIKTLTNRGVYQKDIAAELGVHPKTVRRALQRGDAPTPTRSRRGSKAATLRPPTPAPRPLPGRGPGKVRW